MAPKKKAAKKMAAKKPAFKAAMPVKKPLPMSKKHADDCACCNGHTEYCNTSFGGMPCFCPIFGIVTTGAFWMSSLLAAVVVFAFDMWWNGHLLMPTYQATANLWRPMAEMEAMGPWCMLYHLGLGMTLSAVVLVMGRTSTWLSAVSSGLLAAAPLALSQLCVYMFLPLPDMYLPAMWAAGVALQGMLVGMVVKAVTGCCKG